MVRKRAAALIAVAIAVAAHAQSTPPPKEVPPAAQPPQLSPTAGPQATSAAVVPAPPPRTPAPSPTSSPASAPPRRGGKLYSWGSVGSTFAYGETYGNANIGVGYMLGNGLAPNLEVSYMFGNTPTVWALRPGATWFAPAVSKLRPYVGGYYTHWVVSGGLPDQDGIGARAGISIGPVLSLGVTYDRALGCDSNCDMWTPQIAAGFSM